MSSHSVHRIAFGHLVCRSKIRKCDSIMSIITPIPRRAAQFRKSNCLFLVALFFGAAFVNAKESQALIAVPVDAAYFSGSRSTGAGLTGANDWATGVTLSWTITSAGSDWNYSYTLTRTGNKNISDLVIELTHYDESEITDTNKTGDLSSYWTQVFASNSSASIHSFVNGSPANYGGTPGTGGLFGVEMDATAVTTSSSGSELQFSFSTTHEPVWGDMWARDGGGNGSSSNLNYVYNTGFFADTGSSGADSMQDSVTAADSPFLNWIPRRNGAPDEPPGGGLGGVPEPTSVAVWSLLLGIATINASRRGNNPRRPSPIAKVATAAMTLHRRRTVRGRPNS